MNETRDLYFNKIRDYTHNYNFLEIKDEIKNYLSINSQELKDKIQNELTKENKGVFVKGFYICFKYENKPFYISHHHESETMIKNIIEILKYNYATDIFIKYGEID